MKTEKRIQVVGTGLQAPYGIGEIIKDFPASDAGAKKAYKYAARWYNRPRVIGAKCIINDCTNEAEYCVL